MIHSVFKRAALLFGFVTARGLQVLSPISVAALLPLEAYGLVEWAHAGATVFTNAAMMGVAALVPLYLIRSADRRVVPGNIRAAGFHSLVITLACLLVALILVWQQGLDGPMVLLCAFGAMFATHNFLTSFLRATKRMVLALYFEALPFSLVAIGACGARLMAEWRPLVLIIYILFIAAATLAVVSLRLQFRWRSSPLHFRNYLATLRAGIPIMGSGVIAVAATAAGRFGSGTIGGPEVAGTFASLARIASLCIVAHQFIVISRYKDLYASACPELQDIGLVANLWVTLSCLAMVFITAVIAPLLGPAYAKAAMLHPEAAVWLIAQVVIWSGTATNETLALRTGVVGRAALLSALCLTAMVGLAVVVLRGADPDVVAFARWHTAIMAILFVAQVVSLWAVKAFFTRYWVSVGCSFLLVLGLGWVLIAKASN